MHFDDNIIKVARVHDISEPTKHFLFGEPESYVPSWEDGDDGMYNVEDIFNNAEKLKLKGESDLFDSEELETLYKEITQIKTHCDKEWIDYVQFEQL